MSETVRENVSPEELARFDKLAAMPTTDGSSNIRRAAAIVAKKVADRTASGSSQPANAAPWKAGPAMRTKDGSVRFRRR